jgi:hypothetical protein
MKERIIGTSGGLLAFLYPCLAEYLKKGESPRRGLPTNAILSTPKGGFQ